MRMNLKIFRVERKLSQEEMAKKIGCSRASYSAIESGQRGGRKTFWDDLQKAFLIDSDAMWDLMKNDEK